MNVLTKLEASLIFLGTRYVPSVILLHKLIAVLVNHISEELNVLFMDKWVHMYRLTQIT